jgi:protein O-GlcNAc transferase
MPVLTTPQVLEIALGEHRAGRLGEAEKIYRQILVEEPGNSDALHLLGVIAHQSGHTVEAADLMARAIGIKGSVASYHNNYGVVLLALGRTDEAVAALGRAISLGSEQSADAYNNLGTALGDLGRWTESIDACRAALRLKPDFALAHGNLLCSMLYHPDVDDAMVYEEALRWDQRHGQPLRGEIRSHGNDRNPDRRLRVGYVSADLCRHPVGRFLLPLLAHLDASKVEVFCYSDVKKDDEITEKLRGAAHHWRSVAGFSDLRSADLVREDRIDILVDLALHSAGNRMLAFARKPAPVQVTWLGFVSTTGLSAIDYRITDPYLDPPGENDGVYSEKSIRLANCFWCFSPAETRPDVGGLPAIKRGQVTFGCFNNFAKVSSVALDTWGKILSLVANSRLKIYSGAESHRAMMSAHFAKSGIDAKRIEFVGKQSMDDYLRGYQEIDIALDPLPLCGATTTCDALWMGVPTVTMRGRTASGRSGVSILSNVGLLGWIARDPQEYVSIAVGMAGDLPALAEVRSQLRGRMQASPLMDGGRFAVDMESAYRSMWRNWCAGAT